MIEKIMQAFQTSTHDFRAFAFPDDELAYFFPDWLLRYRIKHVICSILQPKSILGIGVRYGYAARTFLDASPSAHYLGLENNSTASGISKTAFTWAQQITANFDAMFMSADTQQLCSLPDGPYDLVHIEDQRDGDSVYHDLELALVKGRWILLEGVLGADQVMQSSTSFLKKYERFVDYSAIIPGQTGHLLIKVNVNAAVCLGNGKQGYKALDANYDNKYYMTDCGGYDSFRKYFGRKLEDTRLTTVYSLADSAQGKLILDLGCGRGELAYAMAKQGASVVAVDYSLDAIEIARETFRGEKLDITFLHGDFFDLEFPSKFDCIVASDVVEHLEPVILEQLIRRAADLLKEQGRFIVHTAPNKINLEYAHKRRRNLAAQLGCYLPKNPRTVYEDLMHLNEQTPARLNRSLRKYFPCVHTWTTTLPDPIGSLDRPLSKEGLRAGASIFAVASAAFISKQSIVGMLSDSEAKDSNRSLVNTEARGDDALIDSRIRLHLRTAESCADAGAEVSPMLRFSGLTRRFALILGKAVVFMAQFITDKQRKFNHEVLTVLKIMSERLSSYDRRISVKGDERSRVHCSNIDATLRDRINVFYLAFENEFRKEPAEIKTRLAVYLPYVDKVVSGGPKQAAVIDLGCGRGEWLYLLKEKGVASKGVELNPVMIDVCRRAGHDVVEADVLSYVRELPSASVTLFTAFHLVEHLEFSDLVLLLDECARVLVPGGMLILETPNPENVIVGTCNFYLDPTHRAPIPRLTMQFLVEFSGFSQVETLELQPIANPQPTGTESVDFMQHRFFMGQDYGLVCRKL